MKREVRNQVSEETERLKREFDRAGPLGRLRLRLSMLLTTIDMALPILTPAIIGMVVFVIAFVIGGLVVPEKYSSWLPWIAMGAGILAMLPRLFRNISLSEFAEDYLEDKDDG